MKRKKKSFLFFYLYLACCAGLVIIGFSSQAFSEQRTVTIAFARSIEGMVNDLAVDSQRISEIANDPNSYSSREAFDNASSEVFRDHVARAAGDFQDGLNLNNDILSGVLNPYPYYYPPYYGGYSGYGYPSHHYYDQEFLRADVRALLSELTDSVRTRAQAVIDRVDGCVRGDPSDRTCTATATFCGDGFCDSQAGENCNTCRIDCGITGC